MVYSEQFITFSQGEHAWRLELRIAAKPNEQPPVIQMRCTWCVSRKSGAPCWASPSGIEDDFGWRDILPGTRWADQDPQLRALVTAKQAKQAIRLFWNSIRPGFY